jgi:hypothetical protein
LGHKINSEGHDGLKAKASGALCNVRRSKDQTESENNYLNEIKLMKKVNSNLQELGSIVPVSIPRVDRD